MRAWLAGLAGALTLTACGADDTAGDDGEGAESCGPATHEQAERARDALLERYPLSEGVLSAAGLGRAEGAPSSALPQATDPAETTPGGEAWAVVALVPRGSALPADRPTCLDGVPVRYEQGGPFSAY